MLADVFNRIVIRINHRGSKKSSMKVGFGVLLEHYFADSFVLLVNLGRSR
jgi:hypothetical protein